MYLSNTTARLLTLFFIINASSALAGPQLGQTISAQELAAWDISIDPSGAGLPAGSGDAAQGEAVYNAQCASCHGSNDSAALAPDLGLVGGIGSLASAKAQKTVASYWPYASTLFDYIRRAMPYDKPQSLSADQVYALSAYILALNGVIDKTQRLDAQTLPQVKMPNREGFINVWSAAK